MCTTVNVMVKQEVRIVIYVPTCDKQLLKRDRVCCVAKCAAESKGLIATEDSESQQ